MMSSVHLRRRAPSFLNGRQLYLQAQQLRTSSAAAAAAASVNAPDDGITHSRKISKAKKLTGKSPSAWVPEAYRGAPKSDYPAPPVGRSDKSRKSPREGKKYSSSKDTKPRASSQEDDYYKRMRQEERRLDRQIEQQEAMHDELVVHGYASLLRDAAQYDQTLREASSLPLQRKPDRPAALPVSKKNNNSQQVAQLHEDMERTLESLVHASTKNDDKHAVVATEDAYRGLCRALQKTAELAVNMVQTIEANSETNVEIPHYLNKKHKKLATPVEDYVNLAELALLSLFKLQLARATWVKSALQPTDDVTSLEAATPPPSGLFQQLASYMFGDIQPVPSESSDNPLHDPSQYQSSEASWAHEEPGLGVTQDLLESVLTVMRGLVVQKKFIADAFSSNHFDKGSTLRSPEWQAKVETMAERMCALLDNIPSWWVPRLKLLELVMDVQCRVGTLTSARNCHTTFQRHRNPMDQLRFALVLQAYLAAVKNTEETEELRRAAAIEAVNVLHGHWNDVYPRHHVERVLQGTIAMNCLSVADRLSISPDAPSDEVDVCELAEGIVKRTLGGKLYKKLERNLAAENPQLDHMSLPPVNYLAHMYANTGDRAKLAIAKKILNVVTTQSRVGVSRTIAFPVVDTANSVLHAVTNQHKAMSVWKGLDPEADLSFAMRMLDDMLRRREASFWPDNDTFEIMFRLLLVALPGDIGVRGEKLLSQMEVRNLYSSSNRVTITISTYHHVLRCWLEAAKTEKGSTACRKALQLLDKLDAQSSPLLLSDHETRMHSHSQLYNVLLRPTRQTYKLILQTCVETRHADGLEGALEVASEAFARMERNGIAPDQDAAKKLAQCRNRIGERATSKTISDETLELLMKPAENVAL
jgi:hypothetical protein